MSIEHLSIDWKEQRIFKTSLWTWEYYIERSIDTFKISIKNIIK